MITKKVLLQAISELSDDVMALAIRVSELEKKKMPTKQPRSKDGKFAKKK